MSPKLSYDAVVVGAGPNGLAAAIRLAQAKLSVLVLEANDTIGGGLRSGELTLPGFYHDLCSAIHPLGIGSPFFRTLPLESYGLHWVHPQVPLAHPLDDRAIVLACSLTETAASLGPDNRAYQGLFKPLAEHWEQLVAEFLQPMLHVPRAPFRLARFGLMALRSGRALALSRFQTESARALFAGLCAHSFLPLEAPASASFGLVLGMLAHGPGWPMPKGGAQVFANALVAHLRALGGEVMTQTRVNNVEELPLAKAVLLDLTPRQVLEIAGHKLPGSYRKRLERYRYGPGVFKMDYALNSPIPWRNPDCLRAGTVHLGGTLEEIAASERAVAAGEVPEKPFLLVSQPTLFDETRAPAGKHVAWVYCHVPNSSAVDMIDRIEKQLERFAPGFKDCILARHAENCASLERKNSNLVGGDINGGAANLGQLFARPILSPAPYRTPVPGLYLCSASTPPGGGVHGMCGFHAAQTALRDCF